jgi:hypothetical protein
MHRDAGWSEVEATVEPVDAPFELLGPMIGLSPPRSDITPTFILRV